MNTKIALHQLTRTRASEHKYPIQNGVPTEAITKIYRPANDFKLLESAAAFLSRMGG